MPKKKTKKKQSLFCTAQTLAPNSTRNLATVMENKRISLWKWLLSFLRDSGLYMYCTICVLYFNQAYGRRIAVFFSLSPLGGAYVLYRCNAPIKITEEDEAGRKSLLRRLWLRISQHGGVSLKLYNYAVCVSWQSLYMTWSSWASSPVCQAAKSNTALCYVFICLFVIVFHNLM